MDLTANQILRITNPGELFSDNLPAMKEEYTRLAKIWHPDSNGNTRESNEVMTKLNALYEQGLKLIRTGRWEKPGWIKLWDVKGNMHEIRYHRATPFELGTAFIGDTVVFFLVDPAHRDFYRNAQRRMNGFVFADDKMQAEASRYLPEIVAEFETVGHQLGMVVKKNSDLFLLRDVFDFYGGRIPDRHIAWILSGLYNLACYLEYAGLSHNAVTFETYFISPQLHYGAILGGWWYAVPQGGKMTGVPEKVYEVMPPLIKEIKTGNIQTDLESIRLIGRELLGDRTGTRLSSMGVAPPPMVEWLRGASSESAFEEYTRWNQVLDMSFGRRTFVEMKVSKDELYQKVNHAGFI